MADGASTGTLTVLVTNDTLLEATETVIAEISNSSNPAVTIGTASATANITDNETATADLSVLTHGNETGPVNIVYQVTLSTTNDTGSAITFEIDDLGTGSATSGSDYTAIAGSAQISVADGASTGTFSVTVIDDAVVDAALETVTAQISGASHPGVTIGNSTASGTITDNDASPSTFQVSAFIPTASGFTVDFNTAIDVTDLNLYDSVSGALGPADVTVVGNTTGNVNGSLIVSPGDQQVTFVATGAELAPDTYVVTLRSAANGFEDTSGNSLDGNSDGTPGDDYVFNMVISSVANEVVVSIPDFARGFGQDVDLPSTTDSGIPITLSTGQDVTSVDFDLEYDPALLTPTGFTTAISGASAAFNVLSPGLVKVTVSSATEFSSTPGSIELGRLTATVPDTAPYASKHVLDLTNLNVEDNVPATRPSRADDGVHVAAYAGDTSGNQRYSGGDTTLVQRQIVGLGNGFTSYQLADPVLLADLNRGGTITGGDTTLTQRLIVGIPVTQVPDLPTGITPPAAGGPDPRLFIPTDISGLPGETVTVPVMVDVTEAGGIDLAAVDLAITFDSTKFTAGKLPIGNAGR